MDNDYECLAYEQREMDNLFRDARFQCRQHARDRLQHGLACSLSSLQIATTEERLRVAQVRNNDLQRRASLLEDALYCRRAQYSTCLRPSFSTGMLPVADTNDCQGEIDSCASAARTSAVDEGSSRISWKYFAARMPQTRKQPARASLCQILREAGLGHLQSLFNTPPHEPWMPLATTLAEGAKEPEKVEEAEEAEGPEHNGSVEMLKQENSFVAIVENCEDVQQTMSTASNYQEEFKAGCADRCEPVATEEQVEHAAISGGSKEKETLPWGGWKVTLRSHLDGVRSVICHEDILLSCGEDYVVKAWDMSFFKGQPQEVQQLEDIEPYATYRGHRSAVLALAKGGEERIFFSAGQDKTIRAWRLLSPAEYDPYDPTPTSHKPAPTCLRCLTGHSDAVWALQPHPRLSVLASASADGTVRLWSGCVDVSSDGCDTVSSAELQTLVAHDDITHGTDLPTCLAWAPRASALLLTGFTSSTCVAFDLEQRTMAKLAEAQQGSAGHGSGVEHAAAITSLACHLTMDMVVAGHTDCCARVFSPSTGRGVQTLRGHTDAVTAVAVDPQSGYTVATGCHDGILRLFDLRTGGCMQQIFLHQRKFDEAFHCLFHSGDRVVTGGADASIVV
eukprot:CAMPEP_0172893184 /NCGR_PEP_ID=MMETSP1075-20121228/147881_1 /TAXON_ID=2916 /ORGANISM="Ceratium fusus, Strain PA161109" /LENGTH=620 /DNA_ID=CAMNT_0013747999 /DNA_START=34 /DNA_END=1893 /DNA_ORIENTATION=-